MKYEIWDPFDEMERFRKEMDKKFNDFWGEKLSISKGLKIREPLVDVIDRKNQVEIKAEIPGVDKKDVKISVEQDRIEIKAEKKKEKEEKKKDFYRNERVYSGFYKAFSLPAPVDPDKAKAKFDKGILTLKIPKVKNLPKKRKTLMIK